MTPGAQQAFAATGESPLPFVDRHVIADWGDIDDEDSALNDDALENGSRLLSAYTLKDGTKLWIITEAVGSDGRREATTILLPDEY
jgi:hypothetical protein